MILTKTVGFGFFTVQTIMVSKSRTWRGLTHLLVGMRTIQSTCNRVLRTQVALECVIVTGVALLFSTAVPSLSVVENRSKYERIASGTYKDVVDQKRLADAGSDYKKEM